MPLTKTFLRDRVTFNDSPERMLVCAVCVMTELLGW